MKTLLLIIFFFSAFGSCDAKEMPDGFSLVISDLANGKSAVSYLDSTGRVASKIIIPVLGTGQALSFDCKRSGETQKNVFAIVKNSNKYWERKAYRAWITLRDSYSRAVIKPIASDGVICK